MRSSGMLISRLMIPPVLSSSRPASTVLDLIVFSMRTPVRAMTASTDISEFTCTAALKKDEHNSQAFIKLKNKCWCEVCNSSIILLYCKLQYLIILAFHRIGWQFILLLWLACALENHISKPKTKQMFMHIETSLNQR